MAQLLAQYSRVDAQTVRHLIGQLVTNDPVGDALDMRQQEVQRLDLALWCARGKLLAGTIDEVIKIFLRVGQRAGVGLHTQAANVQVRIEASLQRQNLDLKVFADQ